MKCVIIANPRAGSGKAYEKICRHIRQWNRTEWEIEVVPTTRGGQAGELALGMSSDPPDLLAVCGGDGTLNEIATALPRPPFPVAVLPCGTANVVAKELKLPLNPVRALDVALRRSSAMVDLGELGPGSRRRFVFVAGIGFDAYVAASVRSAEKDVLGVGAYVLAGLRSLHSYPFREFKVIVDNREFTATGCIVANAKRYGGGMVFCPKADMRDGLLDILIVNQRNKFRIARFFFSAWLGKAESHSWTQRLQSKSVSLSGSGDIQIQADGEIAGTLPVDIRILPSSFPLVIP